MYEDDNIDRYFSSSYRNSLKISPLGEKRISSPNATRGEKRTQKRRKKKQKPKDTLSLLLDEENVENPDPDATLKTTLKLFSPKEVRHFPRGRRGESPTSRPLKIINSPSPTKRLKRRINKPTPPPVRSEIFQWTDMRDHYISKMKDMVEGKENRHKSNQHIDNDGYLNSNSNILEHNFTTAEKKIFIALLVAYRRLTVQIGMSNIVYCCDTT
jgi:hypothetical protein